MGYSVGDLHIGEPGLSYESAAGRWVILATVLGSAMAAIDATVVGIGLPVIGRQFHASMAAMQWVVTGYLLVLAALLILGGSLGDQLGRRRVFSFGVAWFAVASAACAAAPDVTVLVVTRLLQGAGAALLVPGSLAIIEASFLPGDRARAIGAWSGLGGVATAAGPLLGGYLISAASWRWIFVINVPLGLAVLALTARHVPESRQGESTGKVDLAGAGLTVLALVGITFGLIQGPDTGWTSPSVLGLLAVGTAAAALFLVVERRSPAAMVPLEIFRRRQFTVTNALTLLVYAGLGGALFLIPLQLEIVHRYSALRAGASLLPLTVIMLLLSARSGRLAARIGPRLQMAVGPLVVGAGLAMLIRTSHDSSYVTGVLPGLVVFGLGLAITVAPLTATALGSLPPGRAGLASAVNNDVSRLGGLIAVAVLPSLAGIGGSSYLHPATMTAGFRTGMLATAVCCGAGGLIAAAGIRNPPRQAAEGEASGCSHCALDSTPVPAPGPG